MQATAFDFAWQTPETMEPNEIHSVGALVRADGVLFRLWAPEAHQAEVVGEAEGVGRPMQPTGAGFFELFATNVRPGWRYWLRVNGGPTLPDPASRFQPLGVHGPSQVIDPNTYEWNDADWQGLRQEALVIYELHVGTFTRQGTFQGVIERLDYLRRLGVTAIELMPVADFPGRWNWGYDHASLYAPSRSYGTPDDLRRLVNAAHQRGLAVLLDVVYNHFGPDGAYASSFAPFYTEKHRTPWGKAINLDDRHAEGVRNFLLDNVLYWLREFHLDGLRLDATHELVDDSPRHFLAEVSEAVEGLPGRKRFLIAEDDRNLRTLIVPRDKGGCGLDAVWSDDFHHQMRNLLAGDVQGYYQDFSETTTSVLERTISQGWYFTGQRSRHRQTPRGTDPRGIPPTRFVFCIQNHDQIGNRPHGDRLHHQVPLRHYRAASAVLLFLPEIPLLFMGQEWGASSPFQFFTDHGDRIGPLVTEGRRREFEGFEGFRSGEVPDPQDEATFRRSQLNWSEISKSPHAGLLALYQDLLKLRPMLEGNVDTEAPGPRTLVLRRSAYCLFVAFEDRVRIPRVPPSNARRILDTEQPEYAGSGARPQLQADGIFFPVAAAVLYRA